MDNANTNLYPSFFLVETDGFFTLICLVIGVGFFVIVILETIAFVGGVLVVGDVAGREDAGVVDVLAYAAGRPALKKKTTGRWPKKQGGGGGEGL